MRTLACHPDAEVTGLLLNAYVENMMGEQTAPVFIRNGVVNLDPNSWYPLSRMMKAMNELVAVPGLSLNLTAIGMKIGADVPMPPQLGEQPNIEQVLMAWNETYQFLHRGADVGEIRIEKLSDHHYVTYHSVPYPDDMSYGVLYAYAKRFLPPGTRFTVRYDEEVHARDYGGDGQHTIIHIQW